ncbi:hypothetical protein ACC805_38110, partial [Rhizobium ruizarguesonis]
EQHVGREMRGEGIGKPEQFGTLEALFPGRIDLGLGRAPGTDMRTAQALRRNLEDGANSFPNDVVELQQLLDTPVEN